MSRMFKALCLRDCVQDAIEELNRPFARYRANQEYIIPEDSPLLMHFKPLEQLPKKEGERVVEEENLAAPVPKPKAKPKAKPRAKKG